MRQFLFRQSTKPIFVTKQYQITCDQTAAILTVFIFVETETSTPVLKILKIFFVACQTFQISYILIWIQWRTNILYNL